MSVEKRVRAYLELAAKDAEAAELLLAGGNRYSAYHLQQAVEKITKALLLARGIEAGVEHRLEELFKRFPAENEWPTRLLPFVGYSAYATALISDNYFCRTCCLTSLSYHVRHQISHPAHCEA
jgi:HEPN domain-containing protein